MPVPSKKYRVEMLKPCGVNEFEVSREWEVDIVEPFMIKELIERLKPGEAIQIERKFIPDGTS